MLMDGWLDDDVVVKDDEEDQNSRKELWGPSILNGRALSSRLSIEHRRDFVPRVMSCKRHLRPENFETKSICSRCRSIDVALVNAHRLDASLAQTE